MLRHNLKQRATRQLRWQLRRRRYHRHRYNLASLPRRLHRGTYRRMLARLPPLLGHTLGGHTGKFGILRLALQTKTSLS